MEIVFAYNNVLTMHNVFSKSAAEIRYTPGQGFEIGGQVIQWDESRTSAREKLNNGHQEDDRTIHLAAFFEGDTSQDIHQKRDIYENFMSGKNYFFLNYDHESKLKELEIHDGLVISINDVRLEFNTPVSKILKQLANYKITEIENGEYLIEDLKITIATAEAMGGDGTGLAYFYAGKDIQHLLS